MAEFHKDDLELIADALQVFADHQLEAATQCVIINQPTLAQSIRKDVESTKILLTRVLSEVNNSSYVSDALRLRTIISECAKTLPSGGFISPSASIEFMAQLPHELTLAFDKLGAYER